MTDEEYSYRNRSNFNYTGYNTHKHIFFYKGVEIPVPYNIRYGSSSDLKAWQNKVKESIDRKLVDGKYYSNDSQGDWYDFVPSLVSEAYEAVKPYAEQAVKKAKEFLGIGNSSSYVPSSSSASGVSDGTVEGSIFSDYEKYLNYLQEINNSNNSFNIEQAQKQMDFQAEQNKILMDFNAQEAMKSRNWQEYMSNTAHQREMADLKASGLNPILAVSGGSGASIGSGTAAAAGGAPSGARASADNVFASAMLSMFNSAMDVAEKNASAAITANAVAARSISSDSGFNLKKVLSGVKDFLSVAKGIKGLFD